MNSKWVEKSPKSGHRMLTGCCWGYVNWKGEMGGKGNGIEYPGKGRLQLLANQKLDDQVSISLEAN